MLLIVMVKENFDYEVFLWCNLRLKFEKNTFGFTTSGPRRPKQNLDMVVTSLPLLNQGESESYFSKLETQITT